MVPRWKLTIRSCPPKHDGGVGLAAVGADAGAPRWPTVRPGRCPRRSALARRACAGGHQFEGRLVELRGERPGDLDAAVHLVDVAGAAAPYLRAPLRRHEGRTGSPSRSARARASAVRASDCSSSDGTSSGTEMWLRTRTMMASSPEDSAMASASSARAWRRSSGLPWVSSAHKVASTSARSGSSAGGASRAISRISTLSVSMAPAALNQPRSLASAAATSRSVSPRSAARRAASRSVSRNAGSPVWRWAVPSPIARSSPRIGSGSVGLGVEVEGLGVVAQRVGRERARRARRRRPGASS